MFIENVGQFDAPARFRVQAGRGMLWLAEDALWFTVMERLESNSTDLRDLSGLAADTQPRRGVNIKLSFVGANPHPRLESFNRLETHISYFFGNAPAQWHADVPVWGGVRYVDLYPGIDLQLAGAGGQLQSRMIVRPGANPGEVHLRVEGADTLALDGARLRLTTAVGDLILPLFRAMTPEGSILPGVGEELEIRADEISAPFVPRESVMPPSQDSPAGLAYSTFLGGSAADEGHSIVVDSSGAAYVTGFTNWFDFPTTPGVFQTTFGGAQDVYVTKLNPAGTGLAYSTFLGGSDLDWGFGISVDGSGMAYMTGSTSSADFPITPGAYQVTCGSCPVFTNAFVAKLNSTGTQLIYSTYLGGSGYYDGGFSIVTDPNGAAYLTGQTLSSDFPTTPGAFQTVCRGDAFVTKLDATGSALVYSTCLGGIGEDRGDDLAVDASGAAYITGYTHSSDFPMTPGAFQTGCAGPIPCWDAFVTKLNTSGSGLMYSTFLGGYFEEGGDGIAVDGNGAAYVTGWTTSVGFPITPGAFQTTCGGCYQYGYSDAFVTKLNASGSGLVYSTFLGGSVNDRSYGITMDASGAAYVTGDTRSFDFPTTPGAFQTTHRGGWFDAFVTKLDASGSRLDYSTFLGGTAWDTGYSIALDANQAAYVAGYSWSLDFPTTLGAFQTSCTGSSCYDAFVTKLAPVVAPYRVYLPLILYNQ
jgi:hypothetical protein